MAYEFQFDFSEPVILAFPHLIEPAQVKVNGRPTGKNIFSANFVLGPDHADFARVRQTAMECALKELGTTDGVHWALESGTALADKRKAECEKAGKPADGEYQRGNLVVKATTGEGYPPALGYFQGGNLVDIPDAQKAAHKPKFFFGAEVLARLSFKGYVVNENKYLKAYLSMVIATGKGTQLAGAPTPSRVSSFSGYAGRMSAENPITGAPAQSASVPF
jgi:hypothetical protein